MGFVKLPDNLTRWAWYSDNNALCVYIRLLLSVEWGPCEYKGYYLERGQLATTLPDLATTNNLSIQQTRSAIKKLQDTGKIFVNHTPKFSIFTVLDYDCRITVQQQSIQQSSNSQSNSPATVNPTVSKSSICSSTEPFAALPNFYNNSPATVNPTVQQQSIQQSSNSQSNSPTLLNTEYRLQNTDYIPPKNAETDIVENSVETVEKPKREKQKKPKAEIEKIQYAEFVALTNEEYSSLIVKIGSESGVKRCIEILDNYKGSTGTKYKSDYRTILNWVIERYQKEQANVQTSKRSSSFDTKEIEQRIKAQYKESGNG